MLCECMHSICRGKIPDDRHERMKDYTYDNE
jgi:hypothetical protein